MHEQPTTPALSPGQRVIYLDSRGKRIAATVVQCFDSGIVRLAFSPPLKIRGEWWSEYDVLADEVQPC